MKIMVAALLLLSLTHAAWAEDVRSVIESRNKQWTDAFNSGDLETVAAIYDADFMAIPAGAEPITDREQFKALLASMASVARDLKFTTLSVSVAGDYAYELGETHYNVVGEDGSAIQTGEDYLVIWKKGVDGIWYYHVDAWWPSE